MAFPIMMFAYEFKDSIIRQKNRGTKISYVVLLIVLSVISYILNDNGARCDIDAIWYGRSLLLFYVCSISTCLLLILLFILKRVSGWVADWVSGWVADFF